MCLLVCAVVVGAASAAAPKEEAVQGFYEGSLDGGKKFEARVVATGKGTYKVFVRLPADGVKVTKVELDGKTEADAARFAGKGAGADWSASTADGAIKGTRTPGGAFTLKRLDRQSPTAGAKPPQGAIVLLDGKDFSEMVKQPGKDGKELAWKILNGAIEVPKGGMTTKRRFDGSFKLHVEFKCPLQPEGRSQGRANSGVYLPNGDEIQVLDSFGMTTYKGGGCGGLYAFKDPDAFDDFSLASFPPLAWQTYDVEYRVEKKDGKPVGKPRVTVVHNGIKIHDNAPLQFDAKVGPFHFQDHGDPVQYRNLWVLPVEEK
jgi:hypothetical protein